MVTKRWEHTKTTMMGSVLAKILMVTKQSLKQLKQVFSSVLAKILMVTKLTETQYFL